MKRILLLVLIASASISVYSQNLPLISDHDAVIAQAKKELDLMMADPQSKIRKNATEFKIKGEFIFDITVAGRGKVLSVFVVGSDADDIQKQNWVKDWVKVLEFNFKMPKKNRYKFQYTFNF